MKNIDINLAARPEVTVIPNSIIDQDMLEANELQLKVYLYIMRNANAGIYIPTSAMADHFNETEKDIDRAIAFWEKRGVFRTQSVGAPMPFVARSAASSPAKQSASSALTKDALKSAAADPEFAELRFVAETYMGKPLSNTELHTLLFIRQNLNFSPQLIEYLLEYCAERDKKSFKYVETVACSWSEKGISTPEEAKASTVVHNQKIYSVMNALGKKSDPTQIESSYIHKWYNQYGFESDVILEACKRTVLATDKNRFAYAEKILSSWHQAGIHHVTDIAKIDASFQSRQKAAMNQQAKKAPAYAANNPFLKHQQSNVDYDALEKQLLQQ